MLSKAFAPLYFVDFFAPRNCPPRQWVPVHPANCIQIIPTRTASL